MESRKLSVIMFTDMVGYSKKVQENESAALALLKVHDELLQSLIDAHHGRTVKTIGDAFLVDFDSVFDAVNCAVDIQKNLASRNRNLTPDRVIEVRIGIHVGDVIYRDSDIFGDGVNIASRIESIAQAGQIFISHDVYSITLGKIDLEFDDLGVQRLKNIARPIHVYNVIYDPGKRLNAPLPTSIKTSRSTGRYIALGAGLLGVLAFLIVMLTGEQKAASAKPSLAIVSFSNRTGVERLNKIEIGRIINDAMVQKFYEYPVIQLISPLRVERIIRESKIDRSDLADNPELAEKIARDTDARLMISGSLKALGEGLIFSADLHDLKDETLLASYQMQATESGILGALIDSMCFRFQQKIGERFGGVDTLERSQIGIGELTTQSLEAYRHFILGGEHHNLGEFDEAITEFQKALAIDSNFALAYSMMGCSYSWAKRDSEITPAYIAKLKSVAPRFQGTSKEALIFRGNIAWFENRQEDIFQNYRLTLELYPDDRDAYYYYGIALAQLRNDHKDAIKNFEKARAFAPEYFPVYRDLAYSLNSLGRTEEAVNLLKGYIKNYSSRREVEYARQQIAELRGISL